MNKSKIFSTSICFILNCRKHNPSTVDHQKYIDIMAKYLDFDDCEFSDDGQMIEITAIINGYLDLGITSDKEVCISNILREFQDIKKPYESRVEAYYEIIGGAPRLVYLQYW